MSRMKETSAPPPHRLPIINGPVVAAFVDTVSVAAALDAEVI